MILFSVDNARNVMSPLAPVQHRWCLMDLVKQMKMQLQLWPHSLGEGSFPVFCHAMLENLTTLAL